MAALENLERRIRALEAEAALYHKKRHDFSSVNIISSGGVNHALEVDDSSGSPELQVKVMDAEGRVKRTMKYTGVDI